MEEKYRRVEQMGSQEALVLHGHILTIGGSQHIALCGVMLWRLRMQAGGVNW